MVFVASNIKFSCIGCLDLFLLRSYVPLLKYRVLSGLFIVMGFVAEIE